MVVLALAAGRTPVTGNVDEPLTVRTRSRNRRAGGGASGDIPIVETIRDIREHIQVVGDLQGLDAGRHRWRAAVSRSSQVHLVDSGLYGRREGGGRRGAEVAGIQNHIVERVVQEVVAAGEPPVMALVTIPAKQVAVTHAAGMPVPAGTWPGTVNGAIGMVGPLVLQTGVVNPGPPERHPSGRLVLEIQGELMSSGPACRTDGNADGGRGDRRLHTSRSAKSRTRSPSEGQGERLGDRRHESFRRIADQRRRGIAQVRRACNWKVAVYGSAEGGAPCRIVGGMTTWI